MVVFSSSCLFRVFQFLRLSTLMLFPDLLLFVKEVKVAGPPAPPLPAALCVRSLLSMRLPSLLLPEQIQLLPRVAAFSCRGWVSLASLCPAFL